MQVYAVNLAARTERRESIVGEFEGRDEWTANAGISATPTVLIDDKPLPSGYGVEDLIYLYT